MYLANQRPRLQGTNRSFHHYSPSFVCLPTIDFWSAIHKGFIKISETAEGILTKHDRKQVSKGSSQVCILRADPSELDMRQGQIGHKEGYHFENLILRTSAWIKK